jgi:predicted metal-dependent RNase
LYNNESKKDKSIIIAGSWMCQWWAIMKHLPNILPDKQATIIFVWYATKNTNWWKIKERKSIRLQWKNYDVDCFTIDINGFSAHIDHKWILDLISRVKFKQEATLAINHWWDDRELLAEEIRNLQNIQNAKVSVLVPECWDSIEV